MFVSPTNLHCSQTHVLPFPFCTSLFPLRIYTALKLTWGFRCISESLFPLRIYTALKLLLFHYHIWGVCFPYEFTLLSNGFILSLNAVSVCFPYEFTLLSNCWWMSSYWIMFVSPTNLHCSQTSIISKYWNIGLFPLRIYTALKLGVLHYVNLQCLFPLRIYTALKPSVIISAISSSLFPLRIYTALKPNLFHNKNLYRFVSPTNLHCSQTRVRFTKREISLFPLRIYTALKPQIVQE